MDVLQVTLLPHTHQSDHDYTPHMLAVRDTLQATPGALSCSVYQASVPEFSTIYFTTWDEFELKHLPQEKTDPALLLELFSGQSWQTSQHYQLNYLWGYYQPGSLRTLHTLNIVQTPASQADFLQQGWLQGILHLEAMPPLSYGFLARQKQGAKEPEEQVTFLQLLSWQSYVDRDQMAQMTATQTVETFLKSIASLQSIRLEVL